jgi:hypothetical protein
VRRFLVLLALLCVLWPQPVEAACTTTPNLGLCKGARADLDWDTFLNTNFDLIDSLTVNTGSGAQTKTGTLTLSHATPLKLTALTSGAVVFVGSAGAVSQDATNFFWDDTNNRLGIGTNAPTTALDVAGTITSTGLKIATGAQTGYVWTAASDGTGSWQAASAGASGWADGGTTVSLNTTTDKVSLTDTNATEKLEVGGGVVLGAASATQTGTIEWNGSRFRGWNGTAWINLDETTTSAGGWTDNGATVTQTTATDTIGIGAAADADAHVTITPTGNLSGLKITGFSLSGADTSAALALSGTWNTSGTPTYLLINLTDTSSNAASLFEDFQISGSSKWKIEKDGDATSVGTITGANLTATGLVNSVNYRITATGCNVNGRLLQIDGSGNISCVDSVAGSGVQATMVAFFRKTDGLCPSGYTKISGTGGELENRFARGVDAYVSGAGGQGGADTHTHAVDPPSTTSDSQGAHTHNVDPASTTSTSAGAHNHGFSGTTASGGPGAHTHGVSGTTDATASGPQAADGSGGGFAYPSSHSHGFSATTGGENSSLSHTHGFSGTTDTSSSHTHATDIGVTATTSAGAHTHATDIGSFTSGSASNLPSFHGYVACVKD